MKTSISLFLCWLCISLTYAQTVIEHPDYETKNSSFPEIIKIEKHPDKSVLYFKITANPGGWIRINQDMFIQDSDKGGQQIMTTKMIGGEFGKQIDFPANGAGDTILGFEYPPIPKEWKKLDWKSHSQESWAIYGIALDGTKKIKKSIPENILQWLNKPVEQSINFGNREDDFFNTDTTYLKGYIHGYDSRLGLTTGIIYYENQLYQSSKPIVFQIKPDGTIEAQLIIDYPSTYAFNINDQIVKNLYFEPGKTTSFSVDWEAVINNKRHPFYIPFEFYGTNASTNKGLDFVQDSYNFDWYEFQNLFKTLSPKEFTNFYSDKKSALEKEIQKYATDNKLSHKDSTLLQHYVTSLAYENMLDYAMRYSWMTPEEKAKSAPIPSSFYSFLKNIPAKDLYLLSVPNFSSFVNRLEYANPISPIELQWQFMEPKTPKVNIYDFFISKKVPLNEEQRKAFTLLTKDNALKLFVSPSGFLTKSTPSDSTYSEALDILEPLFSEHEELMDEYQKKYTFPFDIFKDRLTILKEVSEKKAEVAHKLGFAPSILFDVIEMRSLHSSLNGEFKDKKQEALQRASHASNSMHTKYMKEKALNLFLETFPVGGKQPYKLGDGKGAEIFKKMISPYIGKLILVDFWATSCGPCVYGIREMTPLRDELKTNPNVAFVFITSDLESPKSAYDNFVEENRLNEHGNYYISNDEYLYLRELFKFNGIPRYVLIDKNGDVVDDNYPPHNFKNDLEKY